MSQRLGYLSICFQESMTAIVRLRSKRESVTDPDEFRRQMRNALEVAAREARDLGGYAPSDIRTATFAVVAFLDESILNSGIPSFAGWARKPLQEELFGTHIAGDVFFDNLRELFGQPDSSVLADLLEIYALCVLLGFTGRYAGGRKGELGAVMVNLRERIRRIRPSLGDLSPSWIPDNLAVPAERDRSIKALTIAVVALACAAILLFFVYRFSLESAVTQAREIASEVRQ